MSLQPPGEGWSAKALGKDERLWSMIILVMILMMAIVTVGWVFTGDQNPPELYEKYDDVDDIAPAFENKNTANARLKLVTLDNDPNEKALYKWLAEWEEQHLYFLSEIDKELREQIWNDSNFWPF